MTRILGIQPTGSIHIGNYFGAIANMAHASRENPTIKHLSFLADLHALTVFRDPQKLKQDSLFTTAVCIASGLGNSENNFLFLQSAIPYHSELMWILSNFTRLGWINRATQFKEKADKFGHNAGLYTYPILMAADILLYDADEVIVGEDQLQHLEIARYISKSFNSSYKQDLFVSPEPMDYKPVRIMSLRNPNKKMSKSDEDELGCLFLLDEPDVIVNKITRAVTDSFPMPTTLEELEDRAAINNLILIHSLMSQTSVSDIVEKYSGKNTSQFKKDMIEATISVLNPIRAQFNKIINDMEYLIQLLEKGRDMATTIAKQKYDKIVETIGLMS